MSRFRLALGLTATAAVALAALSLAIPFRPSRAGTSSAVGRRGPSGKTRAATSSAGPTAAWIIAENARPGTDGWRLQGRQRHGDIEGFFDAVSAVQGQTVHLFVSTKAPTFHAEAYRMGYYQGHEARLVWRSAEVAGAHQQDATVTPQTNQVETRWRPSLTVSIDRSWPPGDYVVKLVGSGGEQQYAAITVRDDASTTAFVVQNSVTTWQAYNLWGGYDLYQGKNGKGADFAHRSRVVSFDRPYLIGDGSGDFLGSELPLVSFVESLGLDVTYWTDVDFHAHPQRLLQHRALLSLGHDEYWSKAMFDGALSARDHGVNFAFLGANAVFRHIRLAPSPLGPYRREIDYKDAKQDPLYGKNNADVTVDWREPPTRRPEGTLVGDMYDCNPVRADLVVSDPTAWVFTGTKLAAGEHLAGVVGSEYDRYQPGGGAPANMAVFAHSPLTCRGRQSASDMTWYSAPSGAGVLATGTNSWVPVLGQPCPPAPPCPANVLKRITKNILAALGAGPAGRLHPSTSNWSQISKYPVHTR